MPIHLVISAAHAQNRSKFISRVETVDIFGFMGVNLPIQHPASKDIVFPIRESEVLHVKAF